MTGKKRKEKGRDRERQRIGKKKELMEKVEERREGVGRLEE